MSAPPINRLMDAAGRVIYLDHLASTPIDPQVRAAMLPWLEGANAGNPHSGHRAGWRAAEAIEEARASVAALIGAQPAEIVFASGATEANNLVLLGATAGVTRLVVSAIEHPSVLEPAAAVRARGVPLELVAVDHEGGVDLDALERLVAQGPALVSIMAANNEIGTLQPLREIGEICKAHGALFHTDAAQAVSSRAIDVGGAAIDFLSLTAHKIYGPAGIGALYVRSGVSIDPLTFGGGQQAGKRPGTLPVALCVALGEACRLALTHRQEDARRIAALRDRLFAALCDGLHAIRRNGREAEVLPGCLNVVVPGLDATDFLLDLPDIAISTGSACDSHAGTPSHVLRAIGLSVEEAHGSLRFGLGRGTTAEEVATAAARVIAALRDRGH